MGELDYELAEIKRLREVIESLNQIINERNETLISLRDEHRELTENYTVIQASNEKNWAEARDRMKEIETLKERLEIKSTALADVESFRARENKEMSIRLDTLLTVFSVVLKGK